MTWAQFKDHVSHMCLTDAVVASWSLTQEVAGLSPSTVMTNSENSVKTSRENSNVAVVLMDMINKKIFLLKFGTFLKYHRLLQKLRSDYSV